MMTTIDIRTMSDCSLAAVSAGPVTIDRAKETGGCGWGGNGGELLLPAIGGGFSNDIFREAGDRGIPLRKVQVTVRADCSGEPLRAQNGSFDVALDAGTTEEDILDLIQHPDRVAAIPNSLRVGAAVKLAEAKAIPLR